MFTSEKTEQNTKCVFFAPRDRRQMIGRVQAEILFPVHISKRAYLQESMDLFGRNDTISIAVAAGFGVIIVPPTIGNILHSSVFLNHPNLN